MGDFLADPRSRPRPLRGRGREQETLDRLLLDISRGHSRVLVLRGEPGVGKTALLGHLVGRVPADRVVGAVGVETGFETAYGALQQICAPLLGRLDRLPAAQREALATALGLAPGPDPGLGPGGGEPPGYPQTGMAVLGLLAEAAVEEPLVCVVDDAQWIDRSSAAVLAFVARRLDSESVALVFAVSDAAPARRRIGGRIGGPRDPAGAGLLAGLPELAVAGLRDADARALLDEALPGPVHPRVRDVLVAAACGNPLALLELPRGETAICRKG